MQARCVCKGVQGRVARTVVSTHIGMSGGETNEGDLGEPGLPRGLLLVLHQPTHDCRAAHTQGRVRAGLVGARLEGKELGLGGGGGGGGGGTAATVTVTMAATGWDARGCCTLPLRSASSGLR